MMPLIDKSSAMEELLNKSLGEIVNYFGKPKLQYPGLCVFEKGAGRIAIVFREGLSSAFICYHANGELNISRNIVPKLIDIGSINSKKDVRFSEVIGQYGEPHADLGSGHPIPAYLSDHGTCYHFVLLNGIVKYVAEMSLLGATV